MPKQKQKNHFPVMLDQVLEYLEPKKGEKYLDLTAGYGGHASEIVARTQAEATLVDRDEFAVKELAKRFEDSTLITIAHSDFYHKALALAEQGERFDKILADLGVSSPHLDNQERGFSISHDGPLDMRMNQSQSLTAEQVVNEYSESELIRILREYGEEPKARRIAKGIIVARPLTSTHQLAAICKQAWPGYSRVHPATRTFQAIRIAVNDELGQLEKALPHMLQLLNPGGRLAIISFHSLEDAIVKRFFASHGGDRYDAELDIVTKRPVRPAEHEIAHNPRSRSARLRVAQAKIKTKRKGR